MNTHRANSKLLAATLLAVLIGGCAPAPKRSDAPAPLNTPADMWAELENTKGEVRRLNAKVEELSLQVQQNKQDPEMAGRVARLEGNVGRIASQLAIDVDAGGASGASRPAQPQPGYAQAPGQAQPGYGQLPQAGYGQQQGYGTAPMAAAGGAMAEEEDSGPTANPAPAMMAPQAPTPPPVAAGGAAPAIDSQNPADAVYAKGLSSFNAKQYQQALGIFQEFTRNFKTSQLMPNALFWTGECYFQLGDFANAALSYQEVIEKYPKSPKHADALFKRGVAFTKLGNAGAAKLSFKEVIDKYPDSAFAARAKTIMPK